MYLMEIDREATFADTKKLSEEYLLVLDTLRNGSAWNRTVAYWAGQCDDQRCKLCMEKQGFDHISTCKVLEEERVRAAIFTPPMNIIVVDLLEK